MQAPQTRFARLGEDQIAYQVVGDGPIDVVISFGSFSHVDIIWEDPLAVELLQRLSSFSRLILFDRRGAGASDPLPLDAPPNWESWNDDLRAVLDTAGSERASIITSVDGMFLGLPFAATYPERTDALVIVNASARLLIDDDYPIGVPREVGEMLVDTIARQWGTEELASIIYPRRANDQRFLRWLGKYLRASSSPRAVRTFLSQALEVDLRAALPAVRCPTLILVRSGFAFFPPEQARYLADHIAGAKFLELPGGGNFIFTDPDEVADPIEEFLTGVRRTHEPDRSLATVMFTDIVGSTDRAAELGDRRWREILDAHDKTIQSHLEHFQGRLVNTTGDGVVATFDAPGRAIRCAHMLRQELSELGVEIRTGLHTGEVELRGGGDIGGIAVHIAARIMSEAGPSEVFVSRTVRDLVAGSAYVFEDRGTRSLKGVPDDWHLFAVRDG